MKAPLFRLQDQNGDWQEAKEIYPEGPTVLFFYPKDFTPGCTSEVCDFRDAMPEFKTLGAQIFGVSSDSVKSHERFAKKHDLPFPILTDTQGSLRKAFGVQSELFGLLPGRETFVIDRSGEIVLRYKNMNAKRHRKKAFEAVKELVEGGN
ncbi:peroxiredoxin [Croceiramulus getboli]|nr:peroxiredoxin [Flavobacteriaceae bacterium YJPT1-3]